jgi:hypothetical protein
MLGALAPAQRPNGQIGYGRMRAPDAAEHFSFAASEDTDGMSGEKPLLISGVLIHGSPRIRVPPIGIFVKRARSSVG